MQESVRTYYDHGRKLYTYKCAECGRLVDGYIHKRVTNGKVRCGKCRQRYNEDIAKNTQDKHDAEVRREFAERIISRAIKACTDELKGDSPVYIKAVGTREIERILDEYEKGGQ